jgi:hypothetical protein
MVHWLALLLVTLVLRAEDSQQIALAVRAQADFDRVELSSRPDLAGASGCIQSQAAVLPVTAPESLALVHYRRGYCALAGALAARNRSRFEDAARYFEQAIAAADPRPQQRRRRPIRYRRASGAGRSLVSAGADHPNFRVDRRLDEATRSPCPSSHVSRPCRLLVQARHGVGGSR